MFKIFFLFQVPALFPYVKRKEYLWDYQYENTQQTQSFHTNGVGLLSIGKLIGGSSSITNYIYERADPEDHNEWAELVKDKSWNYENILRYYIKSENLIDKEIMESEFKKYHGTGGYLGITKQYSVESKKYLEAFKEIGYDEVIDYNGENTKGYGNPFLFLANGVHQTGAFAYLLPVSGRKNLKILKRRTVIRVSIDQQKNVNGVYFLDINQQETYLKAKKEVIIAAGAINSAKLLLQSRIGPKEHLMAHNLESLSDLPVGRNLIDHGTIMLMHKTDKFIQPPYLGPHVLQNPMFIGRASPDIKQSAPQYRTLNYITSPLFMLQYCMTLLGINKYECQHLYDQTEGKEIVFTLLNQFKPKSRGYVELRSQKYDDTPIIKSALLTETHDMDEVIEYIKHFKQISKSSYFIKANATLLGLSGCSKYGFDNDDYWNCHIGGSISSLGDYSGTCAMGSVVDSRMRVYGINKVRVVDASIIPIPLSAGLYPTVVMLAEKAVEIIIEDDSKTNYHIINSGEESGERSKEDSKESGQKESGESSDDDSNDSDKDSDESGDDNSKESGDDDSDESNDSSSKENSKEKKKSKKQEKNKKGSSEKKR